MLASINIINISKAISKRNKFLAGSKIDKRIFRAGFVDMFIAIMEIQKYLRLYVLNRSCILFHIHNSIIMVSINGVIIDRNIKKNGFIVYVLSF